MKNQVLVQGGVSEFTQSPRGEIQRLGEDERREFCFLSEIWMHTFNDSYKKENVFILPATNSRLISGAAPAAALQTVTIKRSGIKIALLDFLDRQGLDYRFLPDTGGKPRYYFPFEETQKFLIGYLDEAIKTALKPDDEGEL